MRSEILGVAYCACRRCRRDVEARREHRHLERHYGVPIELLGVTRTRGIRFAVYRFPSRDLVGFKQIGCDEHPPLDVGAGLRSRFDDLRAAAEFPVNAPGGQA